MKGPWRWFGLLCLALSGTGCNVMSWPYFLGCGDTNQPPQLMALAPEEKDKEVKVVVIDYSGRITDPAFFTSGRELCGILSRSLLQYYKENKQKVVIVPNGQVNKFKDTHPDWQLDLAETGKHFKADFLVYLDIESMDLYERGSSNQLFRGRADIHVHVLDLHKPDEDATIKDCHCEFPKTGPVDVNDRNQEEFKHAFLTSVAKQLSWYFLPHAPGDEIAPAE